MSDPLLDLQDQVLAKLASTTFFAPIHIISERRKTIADRIDKLTAKFRGIFISVLTVEGETIEEDDSAGAIVNVWLDVEVHENVTLNRNQAGHVKASQALGKLISHLHRWRPATAARKLQFAKFFPVESEDEKMLVFCARFKTRIEFADETGDTASEPAQVLNEDGTPALNEDGTPALNEA